MIWIEFSDQESKMFLHLHDAALSAVDLQVSIQTSTNHGLSIQYFNGYNMLVIWTAQP